MKNILTFILVGCFLTTIGQTKKSSPAKTAPTTAKKVPIVPKKGINASTTKPIPSNSVTPAKPTIAEKEVPKTVPTVTKADQDLYDEYHKTQEKNYKEQFEREANKTKYSNVVKLNFMGLFFGGVNLEYERKIAKKNSIVATAGYYAYGLLQGGARAGIDVKQYLGKSIAPKGMFVSLGSLYNFNPNKPDTGLINVRGLVGHQSQNGHFTFEIAGGPAYTFLLTDTGNLSDSDTKYKIGLLPAFKLSLGYAF
jgi:hypothetical protein